MCIDDKCILKSENYLKKFTFKYIQYLCKFIIIFLSNILISSCIKYNVYIKFFPVLHFSKWVFTKLNIYFFFHFLSHAFYVYSGICWHKTLSTPGNIISDSCYMHAIIIFIPLCELWKFEFQLPACNFVNTMSPAIHQDLLNQFAYSYKSSYFKAQRSMVTGP